MINADAFTPDAIEWAVEQAINLLHRELSEKGSALLVPNSLVDEIKRVFPDVTTESEDSLYTWIKS